MMKQMKSMIKKGNHQQKGLQDDESKPAQLAKLIFPAIVRYIKAQRSATVEKSPKFLLDYGNATRICVVHRG